MINRGKSPSEINWFPFNPKTAEWLRRSIRFRHLGKFFLFAVALVEIFIFDDSWAEAPKSGTLSISVSHLSDQGGEIAYSVFDRPDGFPDRVDKSFRHGFVPVRRPGDSQMSFELHGLPLGRYAVSIYQDLDGNHKLDKNWLGIPKEPVGASNNPKSRMGPPRYGDCQFSLKSEKESIAVELVQ